MLLFIPLNEVLFNLTSYFVFVGGGGEGGGGVYIHV